jgi:hypothetical protein
VQALFSSSQYRRPLNELLADICDADIEVAEPVLVRALMLLYNITFNGAIPSRKPL